MPRKHLIAAGITKKNQQNAKLLMKLAKEIKAAVKVGGNNPETNSRLKSAIENALDNNLTKESIEKNIYGVEKDKSTLLDVEYEIYAFGGLGIIVKVLTDNTNRSLSNLRKYMSKIGGEIAKQNSVKTNFDWKGEILIEKENFSELDLLEKLNNIDEIDDLIESSDCFQIVASSEKYFSLRKKIQETDLKIIKSHLTFIPKWSFDITEKNYEDLEKFILACEDDDDIQWVATNIGEVK